MGETTPNKDDDNVTRTVAAVSEKTRLNFYSARLETNLENGQFRLKEAFYDTCVVEGDLQAAVYNYNVTYYFEKEGHNKTHKINRIIIGMWIVYRKCLVLHLGLEFKFFV